MVEKDRESMAIVDTALLLLRSKADPNIANKYGHSDPNSVLLPRIHLTSTVLPKTAYSRPSRAAM